MLKDSSSIFPRSSMFNGDWRPPEVEQTVEGAIITRIIFSNDFTPFLQEIYESEKLSIKLK